MMLEDVSSCKYGCFGSIYVEFQGGVGCFCFKWCLVSNIGDDRYSDIFPPLDQTKVATWVVPLPRMLARHHQDDMKHQVFRSQSKPTHFTTSIEGGPPNLLPQKWLLKELAGENHHQKKRVLIFLGGI